MSTNTKKIKGYNVIFKYKKSYIPLKRGSWRWKVIASNGQVIGSSTEGYKNKSDCVYNAKSLGKSLTENEYIFDN